ncbi:MAG: FmdB family zinc ribbon protein [Candidatus Nitrosocosmicus sp.]
MPLYDYRCLKCGAIQGVFKKIADLDLPEVCDCTGPMERQIAAPTVRGDYPGYDCPITGKWIEGRRAHEENLKKHGCRVLEAGETEAVDAYRKRADAEFEAAVEKTIDEEIARLPARKRERLAAEMEAGVTAEIIRTTA